MALTMSARSRTASTSSCLIRPATWCPPLGVPPLQQPALGKEELLVGPECVPVGHARDVVGDVGPQVAGRAQVLLRDLLRMLKVVREERPDQRDGLLLFGTSLAPQVDPVEQEVPQLVQGVQ